jgi:cysteine desulfurase
MQIYLDNAATTAVSKEVFSAMKPFFLKIYANPSQAHQMGAQARTAFEKARGDIAIFLNCNPREVIFTGSSTESINLAHKGLVEKQTQTTNKKPHIITSQIEHKATIESCKHLEKLNLASVTYLPVNKYGMLKMEDIKKAITKNTILISLIYVNNEVGTIQPIEQIGKLIEKANLDRKHKQHIYFHVDATQAIQYLNCKVNDLKADLLSFSGHKIHAPKGIGALYIRKNTPIARQTDGGGQEFGLRAGTENVPYAVGLGEAIKQVSNSKSLKINKLKKLQNKLIKGVLKNQGVSLTGHPTNRVPHIASFIIKKVEGEALVLYLSQYGIQAASGSACTSEVLQPSHVLTAMGVSAEHSHGSLRLSTSKDTTSQEIKTLINVLPKVISNLRTMAPEY